MALPVCLCSYSTESFVEYSVGVLAGLRGLISSGNTYVILCALLTSCGGLLFGETSFYSVHTHYTH
jgi:hypothetical protein